MLQFNAGLVERFVRAQVKGLLYMRANRDGARRCACPRAQIEGGRSDTGPAFDEIRRRSPTTAPSPSTNNAKPWSTCSPPAQQQIRRGWSGYKDFALTRKVHQELQARGWKPE